MGAHKLVVMGVSGCGKSTLGHELARAFDYALIEGDEHHLPASKEKMRAGIPLQDADREPWLDRIGALVAAAPGGAVLTCSALKKAYRDRLRSQPGVITVRADEPVAAQVNTVSRWLGS